jgi:hypothetical protein
LEGRRGKQEDGSAKTREVKLCTIWSAESRDEEGVPIRDQGSVTYSAAIESAAAPDTGAERSQFAERVLREATRRGFDRPPRRVILGDCAPWIWNIAAELFPSATQIADRYHVKERLCVIAKAIHGPADPQAKQWAKLRHDELDMENVDAIIQALTEQSQSCEDARKGIDYFQNNRQRMRYVKFHALGLCTSTGVVEAGCKVAIGERLKQSGHALDSPRSRCDYRPTMREAQRTLRGLLGTPLRSPEGCMTATFFIFLSCTHPTE